MAIYVFNKGSNEAVNFVSKSLRNEGISRFGWSYYDTADLKDLEQQFWESMNEKEIETWNKSKFLLGIKQGDCAIHIIVPYWGSMHCSQN